MYDDKNSAEKTLKDHPNDYRYSHYNELMKDGRFITFDINANFTFQQIFEEIAKGFKKMSEQEGPYLVTCKDGTDFTGYACMILEMLCSSSYDEMKNDYMKSYENYYGLTEQNDKELYDYLVKEDFDVALTYFTRIEKDELKTAKPETYKNAAYVRLKSFGMTEDEINSLADKLQINY